MEIGLSYRDMVSTPLQDVSNISAAVFCENRDPYLRTYIQQLNKIKPVILTGDLNVGHHDEDTYNAAWKFTRKKACLTPEERQSFSELLAESHLQDTFRFYYPRKSQVTPLIYW